jgi:hypothetical protein
MEVSGYIRLSLYPYEYIVSIDSLLDGDEIAGVNEFH